MTSEHSKIQPAGPPVDASAIPVLETPRLRLRAFQLKDLPAACAMWSTPEVVRYIGGKTRSEAEVWATISRCIGQWALLGYGYLAAADRDTDRYLGQVGFLEGLRDVTPSYTGTPEAGWALAPEAWGQGLATEALAALLTWSDRTLSAARTVCIMDAAHAASIRIAEKAGYLKIADVTLDAQDSVLCERLVGTTPSAVRGSMG